MVFKQGSWVRSLTVLPDGRIASTGSDNRIWPAEEGGRRDALPHNTTATMRWRHCRTGRLVGAGADGQIKLWPADGKGQPVYRTHSGGRVSALAGIVRQEFVNTVAVLPDGQLVSGGEDGV